jgi:cytochrome c556
MLKKILVATAICLLGATAVISAENMHENREAAMKKIGASIGALVGIAKGEKPYDAAVVKTSLTAISETIKVFPSYFPEGSVNDDQEANPKIWDNMDDFKAKAAKLGADADAALAALPADQAAVGATLATIGGGCGACHELYRIKR